MLLTHSTSEQWIRKLNSFLSRTINNCHHRTHTHKAKLMTFFKILHYCHFQPFGFSFLPEVEILHASEWLVGSVDVCRSACYAYLLLVVKASSDCVSKSCFSSRTAKIKEIIHRLNQDKARWHFRRSLFMNKIISKVRRLTCLCGDQC